MVYFYSLSWRVDTSHQAWTNSNKGGNAMEDKRRFFTVTDGEISLGQIYRWIRHTVKSVDALWFDPVFDMLEPGQSCDINWITKDGLHCMKSVERVA
jgi:hypothetical protein